MHWTKVAVSGSSGFGLLASSSRSVSQGFFLFFEELFSAGAAPWLTGRLEEASGLYVSRSTIPLLLKPPSSPITSMLPLYAKQEKKKKQSARFSFTVCVFLSLHTLLWPQNSKQLYLLLNVVSQLPRRLSRYFLPSKSLIVGRKDSWRKNKCSEITLSEWVCQVVRKPVNVNPGLNVNWSITFSYLKMFFASNVWCSLKLLQFKTEGQII